MLYITLVREVGAKKIGFRGVLRTLQDDFDPIGFSPQALPLECNPCVRCHSTGPDMFINMSEYRLFLLHGEDMDVDTRWRSCFQHG